MELQKSTVRIWMGLNWRFPAVVFVGITENGTVLRRVAWKHKVIPKWLDKCLVDNRETWTGKITTGFQGNWSVYECLILLIRIPKGKSFPQDWDEVKKTRGGYVVKESSRGGSKS